MKYLLYRKLNNHIFCRFSGNLYVADIGSSKMTSRPKRGPGWFDSGTPPALPPKSPSVASAAELCRNLCSIHCADRSQLLKSVPTLDNLAQSVR